MRFLLPLMLIVVFPASGAELRVPVVEGAVEMQADGQLASGEWTGAASWPLPGGGVLLAKQVDERVWLAIAPSATHATYVDLFLQTADGTVHNLHASLQWGERVVAGDAWTDREPATTWGQPVHWVANRVAWAPEGRGAAEITRASFLAYEAHEFGVSRANFPGGTWRLRVEVRDFVGRVPDEVAPAGSTRFAPEGWLALLLE